MNRRSFLALFGAAAAGLLVGDYNPERLTWLAPAADAAGAPIVAMPAPGTLLLDPRRGPVAMPASLFSLRQEAELLAEELFQCLDGVPSLRIYNGPCDHIGDTVQIREPLVLRSIKDWRGDITQSVRTVMLDQAGGVRCAVTPQSLWRETCDLHDDVARQSWLQRAYITPMAHQLAHYVRRHRINAFADTLALPAGVDEAVCVTHEASGITLRGLRFFNYEDCVHETRFDFLGARV